MLIFIRNQQMQKVRESVGTIRRVDIGGKVAVVEVEFDLEEAENLAVMKDGCGRTAMLPEEKLERLQSGGLEGILAETRAARDHFQAREFEKRAVDAEELDAAELCGSVLDRKGISRKRFRIWERINEYAEACGGDTSPTTVSDRRMRAVVAVESALDAALAGEASGDGEAFCACGRRVSECDGSRAACPTPEKAREP